MPDGAASLEVRSLVSVSRVSLVSVAADYRETCKEGRAFRLSVVANDLLTACTDVTGCLETIGGNLCGREDEGL